MSRHRTRIDILGLCSLALAILLQGGCAGVRSVSTLAPPATHVVQPGETLAWVAQGYGVDVGRLARANHLRDVDRIEVGTRLVIPDGGRIVHRVGTDESLDQIAARYGVSATAIARENRLRDPHRLQVGRPLVLPVGARLPPPPPAGTTDEAVIARGRALIGRAEQHYFAARFESAKRDARQAESLLAGRPDGAELRARALFVLASAQAGLGEEREAERTFAAVRAADPRFEPPRGWLSPRLEELYRGVPNEPR
jgi:LysM repeat protein